MISSSSSFTVPPPLAALLARLPRFPGSLLLAQALNLVLAPQLPADVLRLLARRPLRIEVRDARLVFDLQWSGDRFVPLWPGAAADLVLGASASDFLLLAQRGVDPDTLFFDRRLSMEGDTELGLVVKNALDALEVLPFDPRRWKPLELLARLRSRGGAA